MVDNHEIVLRKNFKYRLTAMFTVKHKVACEAGLNSYNALMLLATNTITIKIKKDCLSVVIVAWEAGIDKL